MPPHAAACGTHADGAGVGREPQAAVDASGRVRGLGDDDPVVAPTVGGPLRGDAEQVGGQASPPMTCVGADALVARRGAAPDDAQVGDERAVGEGTEPGAEVTLGQCGSGLRLRLRESPERRRVVLPGSVVLRHGLGHRLGPVAAAQPAHGVAVGTWCPARQGPCREHVVELQVEPLRDPGFLVLGHPGQADRNPGHVRKGAPERADPPLRVAQCVIAGDEQAVAPMEVWVVGRPNHQVVRVVLDDGAGELEDGQVGCPARWAHSHDATLPECPLGDSSRKFT